MKLTEIYADEVGETHFRETPIALQLRDFAPPSPAVGVSSDEPATTAIFLAAPPGWDEQFHPTPRKQYAILLSGRLRVEATDGDSRTVNPGDIVLLNDADSKGHLSTVLGDQPAQFLLVGLGE